MVDVNKDAVAAVPGLSAKDKEKTSRDDGYLTRTKVVFIISPLSLFRKVRY
jgi:hypothetical protein